MKINISEFPYQPKAMGCCKECKGKKKDCEPNPMDCIDFMLFNYDFLKEKGLIVYESKEWKSDRKFISE